MPHVGHRQNLVLLVVELERHDLLLVRLNDTSRQLRRLVQYGDPPLHSRKRHNIMSLRVRKAVDSTVQELHRMLHSCGLPFVCLHVVPH